MLLGQETPLPVISAAHHQKNGNTFPTCYELKQAITDLNFELYIALIV